MMASEVEGIQGKTLLTTALDTRTSYRRKAWTLQPDQYTIGQI